MVACTSRRLGLVRWGLLSLLFAFPAQAGLQVIGSQYRQDQIFPEFNCQFFAKQLPNSCSTPIPGGSVHVLLKNTGTRTESVSDVKLAGVSLASALRLNNVGSAREYASIFVAKLPAAQLQALIDSGEPVWFKVDPLAVPPGGIAQVTVRLRLLPVVSELAFELATSAGPLVAPVAVNKDQPRLSTVRFSLDRKTVFLYWHHPTQNAGPISVKLDDVDVTDQAVTVQDPTLPVSVTRLELPAAPARGSYHAFAGTFPDGASAIAGLRAWSSEFFYATWGSIISSETDVAEERRAVDEVTNHGVNGFKNNPGTGISALLKSQTGLQYAQSRGLIGHLTDKPGMSLGTWAWYLKDEPDAADSRVTEIPNDSKRVGALAMMVAAEADAFRQTDATVPTVVNVDQTYKPYNYYTYGQLSDMTSADPYYHARLRDALWWVPNELPAFTKATYVNAVAQVVKSASEPNPTNTIIWTVEWIEGDGRKFPYSSPEEKRIEIYYALAAGTTSISYWWFNPSNVNSNGLGGGLQQKNPDAIALWREIGLAGSEIRTLSTELVTGSPATLPMKSSPGLWVRTHLVGLDTVLVFVVNDQYSIDDKGTHYTPIEDAHVALTLPSWLTPTSAFEVASGGLRNVGGSLSGQELDLSIGKVNVTRLLVVTADPSLRPALQERFDKEVKPRVCAMASDVCVPGPETDGGIVVVTGDAGSTLPDAGPSEPVDGGEVPEEPSPESPPTGGCSCAQAPEGLVLLAVAGLASLGLSLRRRRAPGQRTTDRSAGST